MYRFAVIPTRDRHRLLFDCVHSIIDQVDRVIIVDNRSVPYIARENWGMIEWWDSKKITVIQEPTDPPNISNLWNQGIDLAECEATDAMIEEWDVAVLNSDVVVPHHWFEKLSVAMRSTSAVLAYPDQHGGGEQVLHLSAEPVSLHRRITGFAYMLRGEKGLRLDESMQWWYSDDDLDWTARVNGGALLVPGLGVEHREPNVSTNMRPDLQEQAGRDRQTFAAKWGRTPH